MRTLVAFIVFLAGSSAIHAGQRTDFDVALGFARDGKAAAAAALFENLAKTGDGAAQMNLAVMLARGQGIPQDDQRAAYWAWRARLGGELRAAALSDHLLTKLTKAARAALVERLSGDLKEIAMQGDIQALMALGRVDTEIRTPARPQQAALWFTLAAAFELRHAPALRDITMRNLEPAQRLSVQETARTEFARWCGLLSAQTRPPTCADR